MRRHCYVLLAIGLAFGGSMAYANLLDNIWTGLNVLATPGGSPLSTLADGTRINGARSGRVRIVPDGIGGGYQLEFDRTFGADSRGRPETIRFGGLSEITLEGATQATIGYSGSGYFTSLHGDIVANNLGYNMRTKNGAQDVQLVGVLNVSDAFEVNPLGFYTLSLRVSNASSELRVNGVAVRDTQSTNFDVGPITIQGNLFYDATVAGLTGLGVDTTDLENVFPASPIGQIDQQIRAALENAGLTEDALAAAEKLVPAVTESITKDMSGELTSTLADGSCCGNAALVAPEPGTVLLFATGTLLIRYARRRR